MMNTVIAAFLIHQFKILVKRWRKIPLNFLDESSRRDPYSRNETATNARIKTQRRPQATPLWSKSILFILTEQPRLPPNDSQQNDCNQQEHTKDAG